MPKERPECFKRWRLWAAGFGEGWEWTKCKDVVYNSLFSRVYRACKEWKEWTGREHYFERMEFASQMVFKTIENGWQAGFGPNGKPYWMCAARRNWISRHRSVMHHFDLCALAGIDDSLILLSSTASGH